LEYHFDRVDFVYEPGQFSIRGGIVDVFSYANEGTISSGLEEIQGNEKTTIKMQLKIKL
jgi:transcription-repair coupling factor (superfamily II helicase)